MKGITSRPCPSTNYREMRIWNSVVVIKTSKIYSETVVPVEEKDIEDMDLEAVKEEKETGKGASRPCQGNQRQSERTADCRRSYPTYPREAMTTNLSVSRSF